MSTIFSVSELTRSVKNLLEAEFPFVWVRGQVSNLARPASGHLYFTLSDGDAALSVVWFRGAQMSAKPVKQGGEKVNPLTGEIEEADGATALTGAGIEDGMEVLCAGRLNVYEPRGQYQLVAELVQDQGVGDLAVAFEALKKKLSAKGYFDEDRKIVPPRDPKRVAVITSPSGAAVKDFLRIANVRGTGSEIRIYPSLVQGEQAPDQLAAALDLADSDDWAEVAVLIRGGGSLEDLWAFNTEPVADAIYRARVPVISGVGHEPDVSIADFVADKRVATPSHAAQELWPRRETIAQGLDVLDMALSRAYANWLRDKATSFEQLRKALIWLSPDRKVERMTDQFGALLMRLRDAGQGYFSDTLRDVMSYTHRLERAFGPEMVQSESQKLRSMGLRMHRAVDHLCSDRENRLAVMCARLGGLNPEAPLERGYSLVRVEKTGAFLRSPQEVTAGDALDIRVKEGRVAAIVTADMNDTLEN